VNLNCWRRAHDSEDKHPDEHGADPFPPQEDLMNFLLRLSYSPVVRRISRTLHLSNSLESAYYWWVTSPYGVYEFRTLGLSYKVRLEKRGELRNRQWNYESSGELDFLATLKANLNRGDTVLDVGASVGEFTLPLAKIVGEKGRVLAFEPGERTSERLLDNLKLNGLSNIHFFRKALGDQDRAATLFSGGFKCPSIVPPEEDSDYRTVSESIEIVQGDAFFARERLPVPRAVKIDVEGFEFAVLRGLRRTLENSSCRIVCLEIHPQLLPSGVTSEAITEFLRGIGFVVRVEKRDTELHVVALKPAADVEEIAA
jgi:FkbM family methyltransferase